MHTSDFLRLLRSTLIVLAVTVAAVVVCYFWVDRPVAFYVHRHQINHISIFRWLTYPPPIVQSWSPVILIALLIRRAWSPFPRWQLTLLAACVSLILADQFRSSLGEVCGRYWPETWFDHNPSLIGTGAYGFHPFVNHDGIGSFPSGHAARILGFSAVWWIVMPATRMLLIIACPAMLISLIAMDYHFVGDVIAGSVLGGIVATYTTCLTGLPFPKSKQKLTVSERSPNPPNAGK